VGIDRRLLELASRDPGHLLSFGLGSGLLPRAPGTWGTIAAIPLYLLLADRGWPLYIACTAALFLLGVWLTRRSADALGTHDHQAIVLDEVVGFLVTMVASPGGWQWICAGFVLFRVFDILKPWPIRQLEKRFGGGLGIMLDDILAALYAMLLLFIAGRLL
jgi:phosphatidylglycerophosphatase A